MLEIEANKGAPTNTSTKPVSLQRLAQTPEEIILK